MNNEQLQKLLPFGYLYLVILGIIKESIFYYNLDINILRFSNIMDILISPIAEITSHPIIFISLLVLIIFLFVFKRYSLKNTNKPFIKNYFKINERQSKVEITNSINTKLLGFLAVYILSFFLGIGVGQGIFFAKRVKNGELKFDKHAKYLTFNTGERKEVYLINTNSLYFFYVEKGKRTVDISPVATIKSIGKK